jgi:hypothetical protein
VFPRFPSLRRRALPAAAVLMAAAGLTAAGCGSSGSGAADGDPAGAVPAAAPLYAEVVVAPSGAAREDALAAGRKILRTDDPAGELVARLDRVLRNEGLRFDRDVAPWLGERVAVALTSADPGRGTPGGRPDVVLVAQSSDDDAAREALGRFAAGRAQEWTFDGVEIRVDPRHGVAAAVDDGRVLVGTEAAVRAAITASGGDALAGTDKLRQARDDADAGEAPAFVYADVRAVAQAVLARGSAGQGPAAALLPALLGALPETIGARVDLTADAVRLEAAARGGQGGGLLTGPGAADALAGLPARSVVGLGLADVGGALGEVLDRLSSSGVGAVGVEALLAQVRMATGLDLRRDVLSWMGNAGLFATRDGGALVVEAKDRAAMRAAVAKLRPLVGLLGGGQARPLEARGVDEGFVIDGDGADGPLYVAAAGERFVVAKGRRALRLAVGGGDRIGDRDDVRAAAAQLGQDIRPSLFADLPALADLLGAHKPGGGGEARELLEAFGALVGGSRRDGDVTRTRLVATLPG